MAQAARAGCVVEQQRGITNAKRLARQLLRQERFVKRASVVERKESEDCLVDEGWSKDVLIGNCERAISIRATKHKR